MSCYEKFGWTPQVARQCPAQEAELLAIYFEELAAYQADEQRRIEKQSQARASSTATSTNMGSGADFTTDQVIGDGDDEEEEDGEG